jgi:hypothetical protein
MKQSKRSDCIHVACSNNGRQFYAHRTPHSPWSSYCMQFFGLDALLSLKHRFSASLTCNGMHDALEHMACS